MSETTIELPVDGRMEDAPPAKERTLSTREQMMATIVERAEERRALDMAYGAKVIEESDAEQDQARADREQAEALKALEAGQEPVAPEPAPKTPTPVQAAPKAPEPAMPQTIVIDGIHYTPEQAAQLARDGITARRAVNEFQQRQRQAPPPVQQPAPTPAPILTEDEAKAFARGLVYGDEAENAKAMLKFGETIASRVPRAPQVDPNAIVHAAIQQTRQQLTLERNLEIIGSEYPEIFGDETLAQLAALKLTQVRQKEATLGLQRPDLESFREACDMVRTATGRVAPQPQPAPAEQPAAQAARLERKRAAPSIPQAADRRVTAPSGYQPQTYASVVEQMRKSRGQMPMM